MGGTSQRGSTAEETKTMAVVRSARGAFTEHCEWTGETAEDRESWLRARRLGIGGSDAAAIMGVDEYKSELAVYAEKVSEKAPDEASSEVAEWGTLFEPIILKTYANRSQRHVVRGGRLLRSKRVQHHLITLDGVQLTKPPAWARGPGVAEVKTTGFGGDYKDDVPVKVQIQMQWQLFVTGAEWATCIWLPFPERRMQWIDVAPHPEFQEVLASKVDAFWQRVQKKLPPDPDGSESSRLALRELYPEDSDEVVRILGATSIADEFQRNKAAIELLEQRQSLIKNMLAATVRSAKYAVLEDGRYWGASVYGPRQNRCRHCSEVLSETKGYRTLVLREPRKKAFDAPVAVLRLPAALFDGEPDLVPALEASRPAALPANAQQDDAASLISAPPANEQEHETA
jgi:putative phage-type endonuclease